MAGVVSMFRGINLGSHRRVSMEALRAMFELLGLSEARSHVASGNIVFRADARDLVRLARKIEREFKEQFGFHSDVLLRTAAELRGVIAKNPFAGREGVEPAKLLVWFLEEEPPAASRAQFGEIRIAPEEARLEGRELYIYFPNGQGRSKAPMAQIERAIGGPGTGRNWNTVEKLAEMAGELEK